MLDKVLSNYGPYVDAVNVNHALESEDGKVSDHNIVQLSSTLPKPRAFVWEAHQYLKTTREGDRKLTQPIRS